MDAERELALELAEKEFLRAATAVWRQLEKIETLPGELTGLRELLLLRQTERDAWERYRDALEAAGRA